MKNLWNFKFFGLILLLSNLTGLAAVDKIFADLRAQLKADAIAETRHCMDCLLTKKTWCAYDAETPLCFHHYEAFSRKYLQQKAATNRLLALEIERRRTVTAGRQGSGEPLPPLTIVTEYTDRMGDTCMDALIGEDCFSAGGNRA
jgi:hypothetical protein